MKRMKISLATVSAILLATAAFTPSVEALPPVFTASTSSTADADVNKLGATAFAFDYSDFFVGPTSTTTVNGVVFSGNEDDAATGVDFTVSNFGASDNNGVVGITGMSSNYVNILAGLGYNAGVTGSISFSGLKSGDVYALQIFSGTTGLGSEQSEILTDSAGGTTGTNNFDNSPTYNDFITETFTASSSPETISITGSSGGYIILNAVNLRDLSAPEPSTYAMMLGGLALIGFCLRRKLA